MKRIFLITALVALSSCANITATPLDADGIAAAPNAASGFRYYMPRPYLVVAELPSATPADQQRSPPTPRHVDPPPGTSSTPGTTDTSHLVGAGAPTPAKPDDGGGDKPNGSQNQASAPQSDTSFIGQTANYIVKLIYLPDYSRPMAVSMQPGIFGSAQMQIALQDGWMLTSVSANSDNSKGADIITGALSALSGLAGGGASKAASAAKSATSSKSVGGAGDILRPGLYALDYKVGQSRVLSVCAVAYFTSSGPLLPQEGAVGACGSDQSKANAYIPVSQLLAK